MRTLIVDDEPLACSRMTRLCEERHDLQVVAQASSGAAAIDAIRAHRPDLVLLDVELQDMTGFDVLRSLGEVNDDLFAIMVTAHPQYALQAFRAEALDFLTKPVDEQRFDDAIARAQRRVGKSSPSLAPEDLAAEICAKLADSFGGPGPRLIGEKAHRLYFLDPAVVDYIEADGNYVSIHAGQERYISRNTLKYLAVLLGKAGFVRIERSLLVNLRRVSYAERLGQGEFAFTLLGGQRLLSGKSHRKTILAELRRGTQCA